MTMLSSLPARARGLMCSLTCPQTVRTNRDTGLIRLLACLFMLVDHAGKMLFPQIPELRLIGRLAFPMFAYGIAVGAVYTRNPIRYLSRIVLLMLISQPLYALGLDHEVSTMYTVSFLQNPLGAARAFYLGSWSKPSILLSLALGLCILIALRKRQWVLALGVYVLCCRFSTSLDYGIGGIRLMILFYALCEHPLAALAAVSVYMIAWSGGTGYTFFGHEFGMRIFALPAAVFCCLPMKRRITLPRWFVYGFYPAHLAVLAVLTRIF
ncbi:MAG: TraX family protein [Candidatus Ventricola sp.]